MDDSGNHVKKSDKNYNGVVGTALFASISAHEGSELSRRDDIESFLYTLIYLVMGSLPWKNINMSNKGERHQLIKEMKEELVFNPKVQESLVGVPQEFFDMLSYSKKLKFNEDPDYKYLKQQL